MNMTTTDEPALAEILACIPKEKLPQLRFISRDEKVKAGPHLFLAKLREHLSEVFNGSLFSYFFPKMVSIRVEETGDVVVANGITCEDQRTDVLVPKLKFLSALRNLMLFGYGKQLRKLVGDAVFSSIERCVNHGSYWEEANATAMPALGHDQSKT